MTKEEFDALLRHSGFMRALARSLIFDEHAADDAVQETWLGGPGHGWERAGRSVLS